MKMNVTKTISILMLAAAAASAQTAATTPTKKSASSAASTKPASQMAPAPAKKPAVATATAKPVKKATAVATKSAPTKSAATAKAAKTANPAKSAAAPKAVAKTTVSPAQRASTLSQGVGKRDPFVSVIVARTDNSASCSGGKRCLIVDQLALRGIVRTPTKWIALVENPSKKTYYLYENDPIFNAVVVRITGDSVIFREQVMDALGHQTEREVVKRVSAPAI
jgi:hypothetical protein